MPNKEDDKQENFELSEKQIALVKLATLSAGLSTLFTMLITETDNRTSLRIVEKINDTMNQMDNLIMEELLEIDLTDKRD